MHRISSISALFGVLALCLGVTAVDRGAVTDEQVAAVPSNHAGWPLQTYVVFAGTLGAGNDPNTHNVAYSIHSKGWRHYIDHEIRPLLEGQNPPARICIHCVGPGWPRLRDGEPHLLKSGRAYRWFEYDWPLTVVEGREREDGAGRWRALPKYREEFQEAWREVAEGELSGGFPIETYAYTGLMQTTWLEALRESDEEAYRERLIRVAEFFRDAGFAGMYVDASSSRTLPADHLGLRVLREIDGWPDFFVGIESYPPAVHDETTGPLRYFMTDGTLRSQHPRYPECRNRTWQTELQREGLVVWLNNWRGGPYRLTPEKARLTAAMGNDIGVSWKRWAELAPFLPAQQLPPIDLAPTKKSSQE